MLERTLLLSSLVWLGTNVVIASDEQPSQLAARAAEAFDEGRFDEAAELYTELSARLPRSIVIVGSDLYYVARSQLRAFEGGKIWPLERLQETVILKLPIEPPVAAVDLEEERASLLEMARREIQAHLDVDADWIADTTAESFVSASSGRISRASREDVRRFFTGYLDGVTYSEYVDLEPPIVRVSDDGSMGWVLSRTRVRRSKGGAENSFVYAGIMTYEKKDGEWVRVANVSTFE
jgi:hypothetical protein